MPTNADLETAKFEEFNKIAMLKKATQQTRDQHFAFFKDYLASKQEMDMVELLSCQEGRNVIARIHSAFFYTLRVRDDKWPMLGYAEGIRSYIKNQILKNYDIDISSSENFPDKESNWKKYTRRARPTTSTRRRPWQTLSTTSTCC